MRYPKPLKPMVITQPWGVFNYDKDGKNIYERFGFLRHNGTDYAQTSTGRAHCPVKGKVVRTGYQPNGGGIFISVTDGEMLFDFLHMKSLALKEGDAVEVGDFLGIQDNTGFSTGPHTHIQARRIVNYTGTSWEFADKNDANDSIDPESLWSSDYAEDIWNLLQQKSLLEGIIQLFQLLVWKKTGK